MTEEKRILLNKVNSLIQKKTMCLLVRLPAIHTIDDGVIIRFFNKWDNCKDDEKIKYKKIPNLNNPDEVVIFFYLPKGAFFEMKKRDYISCITCLSGKIKLIFSDGIQILESYTKICLSTDIFEGFALENTYLITSNHQPLPSAD